MGVGEITQQIKLKLDPRTKFVLLFGVGSSCLMLPPFWLEIATFILLSLLLIASGRFRSVVKFAVILSAMISLDIIVVPNISGGGVSLFLSVARMARLILPIFMAAMLLLKTTAVSEFIISFERMRLPVKVIIPFSVMFRFIPTISEEWKSIRDAMRFRGIGISVKSVLTKPMMTLEYTMVPLLMSTATIADELAAASLSRGLDADTKRSCIGDIRLHGSDYLLMLFSVGSVIYGGLT